MSKCRIEKGDASQWNGKADFILTNPYAPIPPCLWDIPSIISMYEKSGSRQARAEEWIGGTMLHPIGVWGEGGTNRVYVANLPVRQLDISDLVEDRWEGSNEWMPVELPWRLMALYADILLPNMTCWDGFCGRATIGAACRLRQIDYIGIDISPFQVERAKRFLATFGDVSDEISAKI